MEMRKLVAVGAMVLAACGGAQPHTETPAEAPIDAGPAPAEDASPDAAPNVPLACSMQGATCTEYRGAPPERAQELRDQCAKAGGAVLEACPVEKVAATCTVAKPPMTVISTLYRAKSPKKARGIMANARRSCEANGGAFSLAKR